MMILGGGWWWPGLVLWWWSDGSMGGGSGKSGGGSEDGGRYIVHTRYVNWMIWSSLQSAGWVFALSPCILALLIT